MVSALLFLVALPCVSARVNALHAQKPPAPRSSAKQIQLMVRPRVGDTLWLQLDQVIETRSIPTSAQPGASTSASGSHEPARRKQEYGPLRDQSVSQTIAMRMYAHSLVEASDLQLTSLIATTDSLRVRTGTGKQLGASKPLSLAAEDRRVRVHVTPEGAMSVVDPDPGTMALDANLSAMPPMLPGHLVAVGDQWERDLRFPSLPIGGMRTDGFVRASFRLDSVSRNERLAYVSMRGTLRREGSARDLPPGMQMVTAGTLHGSLVLDRIRGWITEAETIIEVQSDVTPRPGDLKRGMSLDIRLSQTMRVR